MNDTLHSIHCEAKRRFPHLMPLLFILGGLTITLPAQAQDKLITKDGEVIQAYRIDIGGNAIYYRLEDSDQAAIQTIEKASVLLIKKQDGTSVNLYETAANGAATPTPAAAPTQTTPASAPAVLSEEAKQANAAIIQSYKEGEVTYVNEEKRGKNAGFVFCCLLPNNSSIFVTDDIEVICKSGYYSSESLKKEPIFYEYGFYENREASGYTIMEYFNPAYSVSIKNKTNKIIYLDLGNTFFTRNGQSTAYYTPTSTTTSSSSSSGASVNLGAVANTIGIGGVAGTLANGVNVGGGKTSATSTITYSQRVVAIPPMSTINLEPQMWFTKESSTAINGVGYYGPSPDGKDFLYFGFNPALRRGDHLVYTESTAPLQFSSFITYSYSEDCAVSKTLSQSFFLSSIIAGNYEYNGFKSVKDVMFSKDSKGMMMFVGKISIRNVNGSFPQK
ncbi:MAG: hypothetical protein LBM06_05535 [Prevotellaceae bacterium]|jgi:hypothetical protein|nr:hypothetical protein [Prevotellaceae bacterium]